MFCFPGSGSNVHWYLWLPEGVELHHQEVWEVLWGGLVTEGRPDWLQIETQKRCGVFTAVEKFPVSDSLLSVASAPLGKNTGSAINDLLTIPGTCQIVS